MAFADDWDHLARHFPAAMARGWRDFLDDIAGLAGGGGSYDYDDISGEDADTDVTGAELEELTDSSETTLHTHSHTDLNDIGSYTHLGIDSHIGTVSGNPHSVTLAEVGGAAALHGLTVQRAHLTKTSSAIQNHGGANGTIVYVSWDEQQEVGSDFTHSSENNSRIQCDFDGRVHVKASIAAEQGGGARTTLAIYGRVNGSTVVKRAKHRNYSRGSGYGDISVLWDTEINVSDGDYIEIATIVDDSDSAYTINSFYDECEVIVTRIG